MNTRSLRRRSVITGMMLIPIILIYGLKSFPALVEQYYSLKIYPIIRNGLQYIFNNFPFSIGDILYIFIIIGLVVYFVRILRLGIKKKFVELAYVLLGLILNFEIALTLFYLFWGLNYFREPASIRLGLNEIAYNRKELIYVSSMLIDSLNASHAALQSNDYKSSGLFEYEASVKAVQQLSDSGAPFKTSDPMVKPSLMSPLLNYLGTAGYFNPFTGEAQINSQMPYFLKPFIACHEMAHQTGYGAEDEANFIGFLSGTRSADRLLKYSSYYLAAQEFLAEVWKTDSTAFKEIKKQISEPVLQDFKTEKEFWTKYQGNTAKLSSIFYDTYLKVNKQPEGLKTYNRMVKLTMAYYKKKGLIKDTVILTP